ncbi:MAG: protein kinase [bacterium]
MTSGGPYKIGQEFGSYCLERYLGSGAFKSVYCATNRGMDILVTAVALGFPHQQDALGLEDLEKEFAVNSRLIHPNIVRTYGLEKHEGIAFLVMEYVEGQTLRQIMKDRGPLSPPEAIRYAGLVSEALAYAHASRVLHRDVKPDNIYITQENIPKLFDFGVGRLLSRTSQKASTRIGTVEYMAPEALQGATGIQSDIWSLGITLYEMLTGILPFAGEVGEVIHKIMTAKFDEAPLRQKHVDNRIIRVLRKALSKDPNTRYPNAGELSRDLETVARRTRMADDDESRLEILIRASIPLIGVCSFEEERVLTAIRNIAQRLTEDRGRPRRMYIWSTSRGLRDEENKLIGKDSAGDPTLALLHLIDDPDDAIFVFLDIHDHFTPVTTRLIRDAARAVRMTHKSVLFLSPFYKVPDELQKEVTLSLYQLPDRTCLEPLLDQLIDEFKNANLPVELSDEDRMAVIRASMGLTLNEAERAIRAAGLRLQGLKSGIDRLVAEEKTQVIRKTGILEYYHQSDSFKDVGGLNELVKWFQSRLPVFAGTTRYAGLPQPKGVLLVGVPGCGKSLTARALAGAWQVPLLRLDVGRIFGSLVGASEANLRRAIQTAESVSPCILWIDEVEKGFSGVRGQGDSGVSARVFGTFLSWLQDKKSPVFVVATANDLSGIPPEFLRQGRFDDIFFVGLPGKKQREDIFKIHLNKRHRDPDTFNLPGLVEASGQFSGAEIEQAVIAGLFHAFDHDRELESEDIHQALKETVPLAQSRREDIRLLTAWASQNAKYANLEGSTPS